MKIGDFVMVKVKNRDHHFRLGEIVKIVGFRGDFAYCEGPDFTQLMNPDWIEVMYDVQR